MQELSGLADKLCANGLPPAEAVGAVQRMWANLHWKFLNVADTIDGEESSGQLAVEIARATLFELWLDLELGEGGRRAVYYSVARADGREPTNSNLLGTLDTPSQRALAWVAEKRNITSADPIEAVRRSISRFKRDIRECPIFVLRLSDYSLQYTNGNSFLYRLESS